MYNNNNDFYGNNSSSYERPPQNGYHGYGPYGEPPRGNGGGRKRKSRGWLYVLLAVLGVVVVSTLSIGIYAFVTGPAQNERVEWNEPEVQENAPEAEPEQTQPSGSIANEGTSDRYSLLPSDSLGSELTPEQVSEKVIPSVVCIQSYQKVIYEGRDFGFGGMSTPRTEELQLSSQGSGIVITEDGYIATNAHVVSESSLLEVVLSTGDIYEAKLVGIDSDTDLAVIKIEASGLTKAELGDSNELKAGQYVMAIGNPGGLNFSSSVTLGIVSAANRPLTLISDGYTMNTIQTDAAINPGNSGGPLVNLNGQVVGINSAKYAVSGYEGMGFAITINEALPIIKDLMDYGKVQNRSMLGITGTMLDRLTAEYYELTEGFYVYSVTNPNAGGLMSGDVLTKVNGEEVSTNHSVKNAIRNLAPGTKIEIEFYRSSDGQTYTGELTLLEYNAG